LSTAAFLQLDAEKDVSNESRKVGLEPHPAAELFKKWKGNVNYATSSGTNCYGAGLFRWRKL
jgi:hypothetical protein